MDEAQVNALAPTPAEIAIAALTLVHLVLIAVVVVQILRGVLRFPVPIWQVFALICLPVVGPLLVLSRQRQVRLG